MVKFNKKKFNELVPISNNNNGLVETVNARDLWEYLGSKRQFTDWIKFKIKKYGFVESVDYTTISRKNEIAGSNGFKEIKEYHITIDMAKHCAMTENTPLGMSVRQYYIDRDKQLRNLQNDERLSPAWQMKRIQGKEIRADLCEVIELLIEHAKAQGSENAGFYYMVITIACNKALYRVSSLNKINKNLRDELDFRQLINLEALENILVKQIVEMVEKGVYYKDIYQKCKEICDWFAKMTGKQKPHYITENEYSRCMDKKTHLLYEKEQKQLQLF